MAGNRFNLQDGHQEPASPGPWGAVSLGRGLEAQPGIHPHNPGVQPVLGAPPNTERGEGWPRAGGWLSLPWGSPGLGEAPGVVSALLEELLPLSSLPGAEIEKGKEGCKGQTMSQKLQEGQREKQQACYWK